MKKNIPKNIVLIGGGHSHAIVLKLFGIHPLPGVNLILITPDRYTPYSGMLPGYIAGFYQYNECHIDLQNLCKFAHAKLYLDQVIGLNLDYQKVFCANHPAIDFDILSINIGSTPEKSSISGAAEHTIAAKPVAQLLEHWHQLQENIVINSVKNLSIGMVGSGAGGIELALSIQTGLENLGIDNLQIDLWQRGDKLMRNYHLSVQKIIKKILINHNIKLHLGETVAQISSTGKKLQIQSQSGLALEYDQVFCVTQASPADWVKNSGIGTDVKGFILVDNYLKSITHPHIFATGDIASMINYHLPKAGVFAVRQGKPLYENLRRTILGKSLISYHPQTAYLSLISTGNRQALANRGSLTLPPHPLLWHWKNCIDRHFMEEFQIGL